MANSAGCTAAARPSCQGTMAPDTRFCCSEHCNQYQETSDYRRICKCIAYDGSTIPNCSEKDASFPVATAECINTCTNEQRNISRSQCDELRDVDPCWTWDTCYCCCSCFAWGTKIAVSGDEVKLIQNFQVGDPVRTASVEPESGKLVWGENHVSFSSGTSPGGNGSTMLSIYFGNGNSIIVTPDHVFMLSSGKLKKADTLVPGVDELLSAEGNAVALNEIKVGRFYDGVHHISSDADKSGLGEGVIDGHLINSNGIVSADFALQISFGDQKLLRHFVKDCDKLPVVGSAEYKAAHADSLDCEDYLVKKKGADVSVNTVRSFTPFGANRLYVPPTAQVFVTREQAIDIIAGPKRPYTNTTNVHNLNYLIKLFRGFFPEINFYLDWEGIEPNIYAFELYGQKTVVISGQLLRTEPIYQDGLAVIMAHGVAVFNGAPPANALGYACMGQADYFGVGYVLQTIYFGSDWLRVATSGVDQVNAMFDYISAKNGEAGNDVCLKPSIDCRKETMELALMGGELPECAGGPEIGGLHVTGAQAQLFESYQTVTVQFNMNLSPYSAEKPENYHISPESVVSTATVMEEAPNQVLLTVLLQPGIQDFEVRVYDVYAYNGSTLDPDHNSATFSVQA